jgi:hypothetical protein
VSHDWRTYRGEQGSPLRGTGHQPSRGFRVHAKAQAGGVIQYMPPGVSSRCYHRR